METSANIAGLQREPEPSVSRNGPRPLSMDWITDDLLRATLAAWSPRYEQPLNADDAVDAIAAYRPGATGWRWLEPRLSYANAAFPDAFIAAGRALSDPSLIERGTHLLHVLISIETGPDGPLPVDPMAPGRSLFDDDEEAVEPNEPA